MAVPDDSFLSQFSKDLSLQQTFSTIEQNLDENNLDLDDQEDVLPSAAGNRNLYILSRPTISLCIFNAYSKH